MSNQGVNGRLRELADEGLVHRKKVGARAVIYWLTDDGQERASEFTEP